MWVEKLARAGYAAKGVVYGTIGILAIQVAISSGGKTTDSSGALRTIVTQPFGQFLLILVAIGLFGYSLWRLIEAIFDPESRKTDSKNIVKRIGYLFSGLIYGALGVQAVLLVTNSSSSSQGNSNSTSDWTARLMAQPFGRWLVALVGVITIGVGLYRLYSAYKVKFRRKLNLIDLDANQQKWIIRISRFGIAARGVIFLIIGGFFLQASRQYDPSEAKGLDGVLQTLARQPYGKVLLGIVALGLIAYAIYLFVQARYRQIPASNVPDSLPRELANHRYK
ncbi:DUF1206 domain-containing protein [Crocosphaera chwakensis]|uniref:DUF1206 domain-containing protein n=1 Tax=Crocosphaera chwakensis CCY0110 TaxID=391612 RepID=A3IX31_9CHRO|nr:DUF1206 domain-containing protein [Crocosphaera chwakensis]EAZ88973.1 hypothetical protein CY0110_11017 [Crocosphaera chwakensis CCY0110]